MAPTLEAETRADTSPGVRVEDVEYQRQGGRALLARLYRPAGDRAVPGGRAGAWRRLGPQGPHRQRFHGAALAESGILVASIDFRMPPEAGYPASLADINLGDTLAEGARPHLWQPAGLGRDVRHVERRASGVARGDAPGRPALCRAAVARGAGDRCARRAS